MLPINQLKLKKTQPGLQFHSSGDFSNSLHFFIPIAVFLILHEPVHAETDVKHVESMVVGHGFNRDVRRIYPRNFLCLGIHYVINFDQKLRPQQTMEGFYFHY